MKFVYGPSLVALFVETMFHCVSGEAKFGLIEPKETQMLEMKPLFYTFDDSNRGSKFNRLMKKNRKKGSGKRREAYRLFTSDDNNNSDKKESSNSGSNGGDSNDADASQVVKIDKGLLQIAKEHELDHLDHDSKSGEDKFVKMIWDKGDGFVKRWHWDRGEKIKENHLLASKKHLEHHDKGKVDEHVETQQGVVLAAAKNENSIQTNDIENMAKSAVSSDKVVKNDDDIVDQLRLKISKQQRTQQQPPLQSDSDPKSEQSTGLEGQQDAYGNENGGDNNNENQNNRISILLGSQSVGNGEAEGVGDADADDGATIDDHGFGKLGGGNNRCEEILVQRGNNNQANSNDDDGLDESRSKARRFPIRKHQRNKNEKNENENDSDDSEDVTKNKVKKVRDYHRKVTVREEKSELAAQERYRTGDKNADESGDNNTNNNNKESNENVADNGDNGYESGSKGSGYIKHYQLTSDRQKRPLNPLDFTSIIGDQSLQIKTAVAKDDSVQQPNGSNVNSSGGNKNQINSSTEGGDTRASQSLHKRLFDSDHFQMNTLQMINPR